MIDAIIIIAIVLIVGGASFYLIRAKKRGQKCIGCPYAKECGSNCSCNCNKEEK